MCPAGCPRPGELLVLPPVGAAALPPLPSQAAFGLEAEAWAKQASPTIFQNLIATLCL